MKYKSPAVRHLHNRMVHGQKRAKTACGLNIKRSIPIIVVPQERFNELNTKPMCFKCASVVRGELSAKEDKVDAMVKEINESYSRMRDIVEARKPRPKFTLGKPKWWRYERP